MTETEKRMETYVFGYQDDTYPDWAETVIEIDDPDCEVVCLDFRTYYKADWLMITAHDGMKEVCLWDEMVFEYGKGSFEGLHP